MILNIDVIVKCINIIYLINIYSFVLSPSFTHQLLPILYYFKFMKSMNYIYLAEEGDAYGEFTGKVVTRLQDISNFVYKGSLYISFKEDDIAVYNQIIEFISFHLKTSGVIICTINPTSVRRFRGYLEDMPNYMKKSFHFVFIYSDVFSNFYIPDANFYSTTQFSKKLTYPEAKDLFAFLTSYFGIENSFEGVEMTNTAFLMFNQLFNTFGTTNPEIMRENINDFEFITPHGVSTIGRDYHISYGLLLIKPTAKLQHEILFYMKGPFSSQLQLFFPEITCSVRDDVLNILYLRCSNDIMYSYHDPFPVISLALKRLNDYYDSSNFGYSLKVYEFCDIDDAEVLNDYIDENEIKLVLFGDWYIFYCLLYSHKCKLQLEDLHYNHKYLVFAFGRQLATFAHEDLFYFGISSLSSVLLSLSYIS